MAITLDGTNGILSPDFEPSGSTTPTNGLFLPTTNALGFATNSTERLRLDASGNLGLGVTPSAWSTFKAFQVGATTALANLTTTTNLYHNSYYDGVAEKYLTSSMPALRYAMNQGGIGNHAWFNAPSGTAGNAISFTQAMTLDASGNLGIGVTSPATKLDINGSIRLSSTFYVGDDGGSLGAYLNETAALPMRFFTSGTERARIDSSGNFILTAAGSINLNTLNTYSSASSGYQKLPSGIIIQWGTTAFDGSGVASITFPTAFPTACRFVNASVWRGTTLSGYLMSTQIGVFSTTGVTIIGNYTLTGTVLNLSANEGAAWIAIGY